MEIKDNGTLRKNFLRAKTDENGNVNIHEVGKWTCKNGETYYTIDCSVPRRPEVMSHKYDGGSYDKMVEERGNFFPTREMAEMIANHISNDVYMAWCEYEDLMEYESES